MLSDLTRKMKSDINGGDLQYDIVPLENRDGVGNLGLIEIAALGFLVV